MLKKLYENLKKNNVNAERVYKNFDDLRTDDVVSLSQYIGL